MMDNDPRSNADLYIAILRPAAKNMSGTPVGKISMLANPLVDINNDGQQELSFTKVINADAVEYNEDWPILCQCLDKPGAAYNPFVLGRKGNLRIKKNYAVLTNRQQTRYDNNLFVRKDGVFEQFTPFWHKNANGWLGDPTGWTFSSEVTKFNPYGQELESHDALNRYSSATYGYNFRIPTAMGVNSMLQEIGFDGFEDYNFYTCDDMHFGFKAALNSTDGTYRSPSTIPPPSDMGLTTDKRHSGRYSMKLGANGYYVKMKRVLIPCDQTQN
jgi:hypothetical protein